MTTDPAAKALMDYLESFSGYPEEPVWHEDNSVTGVTFDGVPQTVKTLEEWNNNFVLYGYGIRYFGTSEVRKKLVELMSRLPGANQPDDRHPRTEAPLFKDSGAYEGFMLSRAEKIYDRRANPPGLDPEEYPNREEHEEYVRNGNEFVKENGEYLTKTVPTEVVPWRSRSNGDKPSPKPAPRPSPGPRPGPTAQTPSGAKPQAPAVKPSDPEKGKTMEELSPEALRVIQENTAASNRLANVLETRGPEFLAAMDRFLKLINEANEGSESAAPVDEPVPTPEAPAKSQSELDIDELVELIRANPALQQALETEVNSVDQLKGALTYVLGRAANSPFTKDPGRVNAALTALYAGASGLVHTTVFQSASTDPEQLLEQAIEALDREGYPKNILGLATNQYSPLLIITSHAFEARIHPEAE